MRSSLRLVLIVLVAGSSMWACGDGSFLNGRNSAASSGDDVSIDVGDGQAEECNNGLNEDGDDQVDENCVCDIGAVQSCFPGPPGNAGIGNCQYGTMTCYAVAPNEVETHGEWGPCEGAVLPQTEQCGDGQDSDCNGANDCDECDSGGPCPPPSSGSGDYNTSGSGSGDNNTVGSGSGDNNTSGAGAGSGSGDNNTTSGAGAGSGSGDNNTTSGTGASSGSGDNNTTSGSGASSGSGDNNTTSGSGASSGSGDNNTTSGVGAGSTSSGGGDGCICKPGTIRWCDTPIGCMWGKQVCAPDSTWGTCIETNQRPSGCDGYDFYDPGCCILAPNACCQNPFTDVSMGDCQQQLDCY